MIKRWEGDDRQTCPVPPFKKDKLGLKPGKYMLLFNLNQPKDISSAWLGFRRTAAAGSLKGVRSEQPAAHGSSVPMHEERKSEATLSAPTMSAQWAVEATENREKTYCMCRHTHHTQPDGGKRFSVGDMTLVEGCG
ncbi:hypothetical protein CHARACLAT_023647 [Characodon lateralis]|uniref:Uncharacterized protein n=1 Tax=Characodon lateralis TaxID=208331 RepID=A0ABU7DN26_9TELE|nr:hypothetical protein [Characodon lateralis]